jgi:hypothetical protein
LFLVPAGSIAGSSAHVPVGSWVYTALERLEAEGVIRSGLLATRPVTRIEAARLVREAADNMAAGRLGGFSTRLLKRLESEFRAELAGALPETYLKPMDRAVFRYVNAGKGSAALDVNNRGGEFAEGSNFRLSASGMGTLFGGVSLYLNPEIRYAPTTGAGEIDVDVVEGYGSLTLYNIELTTGREALWWGPGYHGALLMSDNAEPFDLVRLANPAPYVLPWVFGRLGPASFTAFATRLDDDRVIARPYLAGLRAEFRPLPALGIGLSRTAIFGGDGRPVDAGTIWDVFMARDEDEPDGPGNQLASVDLTAAMPWPLQPMLLYAEAGGEDEAGFLPSKAAYLAGVYLPGILPGVTGLENIEVRAEYADNYIGGKSGYWYQHYIYGSGYTYRGDMIGHHMGSEAEGLFVEAAYHSGAAGAFALSYETESGDAPGDERNALAFSWGRPLDGPFALTLGYAHEWGGGVEGGNSASVWSAVEFDAP